MDDQSLNLLPAPYGLALQLRAEGADDERIAGASGVPVEAVAALLEVGMRKLAALPTTLVLPIDASGEEVPQTDAPDEASELGV